MLEVTKLLKKSTAIIEGEGSMRPFEVAGKGRVVKTSFTAAAAVTRIEMGIDEIPK